MNFKEERVNAHNNWPLRSDFKAEVMLKEKLEANADIKLFQPIPIVQNVDPDYQRCVGHLLDALDFLPYRPDYSFDHCFRILDIAGAPMAPNGGIKGVVQKLGSKLLQQDRAEWDGIADALCRAMPLRVYELLAKRLLQAALPSASRIEARLNPRAEHCFGARFYSAFISKFTLDASGAVLADAADRNRANAAKLLKLYFSGTRGTRTKPASDPALDLTVANNVPDSDRRIEGLLSLLLFTIRNERAHGNVISPFRTSKARLERYESYYFLMLMAYVFAMGTLMLRFQCITSGSILTGCVENIRLQQAFFSE